MAKSFLALDISIWEFSCIWISNWSAWLFPLATIMEFCFRNKLLSFVKRCQNLIFLFLGFAQLMAARKTKPYVATPFWAKCEDETHTPKSGNLESSGTLKNSESIAGVKTPCIGVFSISIERSWNVDVQNGLAWAIWISVAQVMGKRRAGSQTGSLTLDH